MSRLENITIKIKNAKINKIEKICQLFCEDFTAIQTAQELGISRQTVNHYYKILRERLHKEFNFIDCKSFEKILESKFLDIQYTNIHNTEIFYVDLEGDLFILKDEQKDECQLFDFVMNELKESLKNHKRANCARIIKSSTSNSYIVCGYFKKEDFFTEFCNERFKKFRGINKEKFYDYLFESQVRYIFPNKYLYQKLASSF